MASWFERIQQQRDIAGQRNNQQEALQNTISDAQSLEERNQQEAIAQEQLDTSTQLDAVNQQTAAEDAFANPDFAPVDPTIPPPGMTDPYMPPQMPLPGPRPPGYVVPPRQMPLPGARPGGYRVPRRRVGPMNNMESLIQRMTGKRR